MMICAAAGPVLRVVQPIPSDLDQGAFWVLALSAVITFAAGTALFFWGRPIRRLGRREATLAVAFIWLGTSLFGGLPYVIGANVGPADAFFEAASGFTTTGATIFADIEGSLSRPLLLWRSVTQWLGGMGIVVLFVAIFPEVGVGGKHLYRSEAPGPTADGLRPRIAETSLTLWRFYLGFTVLLAAILGLLGMNPFDAVCHALTTMSTGGFSTKNASVGHFDSVPIEVVLSGFMLIAGVNFGLYYGALRFKSLRVFWRSTEFKAYTALVIVAWLLLTLTIWPTPHTSFFESARNALFMTATTITSTGFGTDAYMAYPGAALTIVLMLMFVGGSAGSTAGGLKVSRLVMLVKLSWGRLRHSFRPNVIQVIRVDGKAIDTQVLADVAAVAVLYVVILCLGTMGLSLLESTSVEQSFGAMLTTLSNMGPAPFHDPAAGDHFAPYSATSKYLLSVSMILGRLEFFTLMALLLPEFWRR